MFPISRPGMAVNRTNTKAGKTTICYWAITETFEFYGYLWTVVISLLGLFQLINKTQQIWRSCLRIRQGFCPGLDDWKRRGGFLQGPWTLGSQHGTAAYHQIVEGVGSGGQGWISTQHNLVQGAGISNSFVSIFIAAFLALEFCT